MECVIILVFNAIDSFVIVFLIRGIHNLRAEHRGCVATIGSFDGVHRGHHVILEQLKAKATALNLPSLVMVFEPQPNEYFSGEQAPARLMLLRDKLAALRKSGIDRVLCLQFNSRLRSMTAEQFIQQVLVQGLAVQHLVVGDDFRFGCDRKGDFSLLTLAGQQHGFSLAQTHTVEADGERISSTRIRRLLLTEEFEKAESLLGQPYSINGKVVYGQQLGRILGFPTANVLLKRYRSPLSGVFAVKVQLSSEGNGQLKLGVANIGVRPTIEGLVKPILEVFLLDFSDSIYGEVIAVMPCKKIREEKKFDSLERLTQQIQNDVDLAKDFFKQ